MIKYIIFILFILSSCSSVKKDIFVNDLKLKNSLYGVQNNSYFYFMIDSTKTPHLVKTSIMNSDKVIWIEKLIKLK